MRLFLNLIPVIFIFFISISDNLIPSFYHRVVLRLCYRKPLAVKVWHDEFMFCIQWEEEHFLIPLIQLDFTLRISLKWPKC